MFSLFCYIEDLYSNRKEGDVVKKWKIVLVTIIVFFALSLSALAVWQFDNICAVIKAFTSTANEIADEMNETKKKLEEDLKKQNIEVVSDFTAEEEKQIIKGELTVDEALAGLNEKYENSKKVTTAPNNPAANKLIGEKTVELYSLKAYYLGQLGQMEKTVKSEYAALPLEKKNLVGKKDIVNRHMSTALGLMNQCDAKVEEILAELKAGLESLNADTSIIKTIRKAYENEKNLKKAYYLSLLEE